MVTLVKLLRLHVMSKVSLKKPEKRTVSQSESTDVAKKKRNRHALARTANKVDWESENGGEELKDQSMEWVCEKSIAGKNQNPEIVRYNTQMISTLQIAEERFRSDQVQGWIEECCPSEKIRAEFRNIIIAITRSPQHCGTAIYRLQNQRMNDFEFILCYLLQLQDVRVPCGGKDCNQLLDIVFLSRGWHYLCKNDSCALRLKKKKWTFATSSCISNKVGIITHLIVVFKYCCDDYYVDIAEMTGLDRHIVSNIVSEMKTMVYIYESHYPIKVRINCFI